MPSMEDGLLDIAVYPGFTKAELLNYFLKTANEGVIPAWMDPTLQGKKDRNKNFSQTGHCCGRHNPGQGFSENKNPAWSAAGTGTQTW